VLDTDSYIGSIEGFKIPVLLATFLAICHLEVGVPLRLVSLISVRVFFFCFISTMLWAQF